MIFHIKICEKNLFYKVNKSLYNKFMLQSYSKFIVMLIYFVFMSRLKLALNEIFLMSFNTMRVQLGDKFTFLNDLKSDPRRVNLLYFWYHTAAIHTFYDNFNDILSFSIIKRSTSVKKGIIITAVMFMSHRNELNFNLLRKKCGRMEMNREHIQPMA